MMVIRMQPEALIYLALAIGVILPIAFILWFTAIQVFLDFRKAQGRDTSR